MRNLYRFCNVSSIVAISKISLSFTELLAVWNTYAHLLITNNFYCFLQSNIDSGYF